MKLLDRYVSHVIGSLGEYERDVMYRSMIIRRITLFWGTEVAAAALAWTLPANLVWWALIVFFLPMCVSECGAWMYMRNRAVRPRSAGSTMTISEQLAYTAIAAVFLVGMLRWEFIGQQGSRALIIMFVSYVAASVVVPPMVKQLNGWLRGRDERRLEAAFPED